MVGTRGSRLLPGLAFAGLLCCACSNPETQTACTALFAYLTIFAHDSAGHAATGLVITDTVRRTGESFTPAQQLPLAAGSYVVFDDNQLGKIRASGDSVRVAGAGTAGRFATNFVFDAPGGCHVRK